MPLVPFVSAEHLSDLLAVPLPRYAQLVDYSEAAFFGVSQPGQDEYACRTIWTQWQRSAVSRALMNAQSEFHKHCNYPMLPTYITERRSYNSTILLNNCNLIGLGSKVDVMEEAGVTIDYTNDPAEVVASVTATDINEIHIYHPGTDYEIMPSAITITGGTATILIPRVRMVALAYDDNPDNGWPYADDTYFETEVDVRRIYLDTAHQIQVFCQSLCACPPEEMTSFWTTASVRDYGISHIRLDCNTDICGCVPQYVEVHYLCGLQTLPIHAEDAIVRLAHSFMPSEPCGCDWLKMRWDDDKKIPDVLTSERENCPWGLAQGSWIAWELARDMVCYRGGSL